MLSSFGVFPRHLKFPVSEVSRNGNLQALRDAHPALQQVKLIGASDAHYLEDILPPEEDRVMELPERTPAAVLHWLEQGGKS